MVASRTQHFKSHSQVLTALGERVGAAAGPAGARPRGLHPAQIRLYLVNRYDGDGQAADDRLRLLSGIEDLLGLSQNPRMLSFIADLDEERLRAVAECQAHDQRGRAVRGDPAVLARYEERRIAGRSRRASRPDPRTCGTRSSTLAMRLWEAGEPYLRLAELTNEVASSLAGLADGRLSPLQRRTRVGAGSLLVRTDEGLFGFIHASVAEWLVAARDRQAGSMRRGPTRRRCPAARCHS